MQDLHASLRWLQDIPATVGRAAVDFAVGIEGCAPHHRSERLAGNHLARLGIKDAKLRTVVDGPEFALDHDG